MLTLLENDENQKELQLSNIKGTGEFTADGVVNNADYKTFPTE